MNDVTIFWFRRDLRLEDNAGLYYALLENKNVLPVFIFDTTILNRLEDKNDRRVDFIHQAITAINETLEELKSSLTVLHTTPSEAFKQLIKEHQIKNVYTNHDYEPQAKERDEEISRLLLKHLKINAFLKKKKW